MSYTLPAFPVEYLDVKFLDVNEKKSDIQTNKQILPFNTSEIYLCSVNTARYLTQGDDVKTVVEVSLNIQNSNFEYTPGQTIGIITKNDSKEVNQIIERLNLKEDSQKLFQVSIKKDCPKKNTKIPIHVPINSTIFDTLINNLDIRSIPKKLFLRALSKYTSDAKELNILNELCSTQGTAKYNDFITKNYLTLLEILQTFKSCNPPFSLLLEHLPKLQPRPYSISCSPKETVLPNIEIKFVYSLEILPNSYKGICTGWLHKELNSFLETNDAKEVKIPIYLRKPNDFKLPDDFSTNIILIAAGTALAPFIGFLKHRDFQIKNYKETVFNKILLFFGCRYSNRDFIFKDDIKNFVESGVITELFTSFSRENTSIKYVQDNIKKYKKEFIELMAENTVIFVCGSSKMCKDVFETIIDCFCTIKNCEKEEGRKELNELKKQKKYIEDIWT